jgi:hypothetical protein
MSSRGGLFPKTALKIESPATPLKGGKASMASNQSLL